MVDRRSIAKWLPILLGACGGPHQADAPPTATTVHAATQDAGAPATTADAATGDPQKKLVCWLTADPRCKDPSLPRIC